MFQQTWTKTIAGVAIVLGLALYAGFGGYFAREIVVEIAVLAIIAISLDFVAGYGGMISLCHGAIYGLGAYSFAVMTAMLGQPTGLALVAAIVVAALFGLVVGAVVSNTAGIFFIMATLAFGQMAYVMIFESRTLGGDDGMFGITRFDLSWLGLDLNDSLQFALFCLAVLVIAYAVTALVLHAAFGRTLVGIHMNEDRMRALGLTTWKHKSVAFGFSAAVAGVAGVLAAQHTMFVSPEYLVWTVSGEVLVVVILGGIGTLVGPVAGAALLVLLKHEISAYTNHWHMVIGLVLILTVVAGGRGVFGQIEYLIARRQETGRAKGKGANDGARPVSRTPEAPAGRVGPATAEEAGHA